MFWRLLSRYRERAGVSSRPILLSMGMLDELITGIPVVALPLLRDRLHLSYVQIGFLFTAAALSGMLIEPFINLASDRASKRPWILGGLLLLAISFALIGNLTSYALLMVAFIVSYPAGGAAIDLSQAVLIDAAPGDAAHTMTRWTLLSSIGDFLAPLVVAAFAAVHLGWTALCWLAATLWLVPALLLAVMRFPARATDAQIDEDDDTITIRASLREALRDPQLVRWAALTIIPSMLDEVFLSFVVLYLGDVLHVSETMIALIVTLQMLASLAGLFWLESLLKRHQHSTVVLLIWSSLFTLVGVLILLFAHSLWLVVVALLIISLSCAGWYPLAKAEAYTRKPASSGVVRVVIGLGEPVVMALPGAIGLICASFGVLTGLGVLGLAPVLMLLLLPRRQANLIREIRNSS
jgi:predicted MFS family arabinose efflux permease